MGVAGALVLAFVLARVEVQVEAVLLVWQLVLGSAGQERQWELLAAQVDRVVPQAAHLPSPPPPPTTAARPIADNDMSSTAPDRDNKTRFDTGMSCGSSPC